MKNIYNKPLKVCSKSPLTGFTRTGYCGYNEQDKGKHLVCAKMNKKFLNFTKKKGNDLKSILKSGDRWCLCLNRYLESKKNKNHPRLIKSATHHSVRKYLKGGKRINPLPKLRKIDYTHKKTHYKLKDPFSKRKKAILEGIRYEHKHNKKTKKKAALAKKQRFNVLRIYRRNKSKKQCKTLTKDMKFISKTFKLGKTNNIC